MEILEAFYRRKLRKKQKKSAMFHSEVDLNRAPSLASVGTTATVGDTTTTGLITRVLHLTRRRDSRPHSWHSTKMGDGSSESVERVDRMSSVHASAAELLSGLDSGGGVRWSLESLEPAHTLVPPGAAHLGPRTSSSCLQLSSSTSKRDSAYSSFSTSPSFPECRGLDSERSFSLESVQQRVHYRPYGLSLDHDTRARDKLREQPAGGACYHGTSENRLLNRHSLGPIWSTGQSSCESLRGAPAPQRRSETSQERPSSWSSLEPVRSLRSLRCQQKGSWSSSSTPSAAKGLYMAEGQLHTVIEKSPESSPSSKPRQAQSPGPLQEPPCPLSHTSGPSIGLRDHWNGSYTSHRAVETERSFKDLRDHLDMFSSVPYNGSWPCYSVVNSQDPASDPPPAPSRSSQPMYSDQEHPLTRLEKALAEVQSGENMSLSVLEKVSRFEHREWATRQLGLGSRHRSDRSGPKQAGDKGTSHGAEDVRNLPERSTSSSTKACRTLSHGGGPQEKNRSYQELRDPPTQVFRSTSFRCTKFPCGPTAPLVPPPVPQKVHTYLDKRDIKHLPLPEKTGPKTLPKPHGAVFTFRPSAPTASPLTVPPHGPSPGPAPLTRICGRKRLTWDQRKRSFSEPECMNEIGLSHADSVAPIRRAGDTSVADRRRMFEQTAVPGQERSQRRPQSAVLQPLHTADSVSLTSCSGLLPLHDCTPDQHLITGKGPLNAPLSSPVAPGADPVPSRCIVVYPGRVTAPLAPALQPPNLECGVSLEKDIHSLSLSLEVDSPVQKTKDRPERTNTSLSSPPGDAVEQAGRTLLGVTSEKESSALHRAADGAERVSPPSAHSPPQGVLLVSASRRERQRRSDHSTLAASVGLPCPLSDAIRPEHDSPPSGGQDTTAPANRTETGGAIVNASSELQSAIGGSEPKHQPQRENRTIGHKDRASAVHGADSENRSTTPAIPLKTLPCPPVPPVSSPDQAQEDSLMLDYEPVPVRLQTSEEQRVQELVRNLVRIDRSLVPLMDVWGKSTVDFLLEIFPNSQLFGKLSQKQRDGSLQDDWSQGPTDSELSVEQKHSLISRKVELCEALRSCIESLQREKAVLSDELKAHTELGIRVDAWVQERCEDAHKDKYRLFIGDLERVVNLLLSLCGRLARVERSLASLRRQEPAEGSTELWDSLLHKRSVLLRQTQDALELREHLERRQCTVHTFIQRSLEPQQQQHYRRLVSSMPALLIAHRWLDELIQQSQEQLSLLLDTVPLEVTQAMPLLYSRSQPPYTWHSSPARVVPRPTHLDCPVTMTSL